METLDHHNQIHNDIKPQNYLIKFLSDGNYLSCIEIVLTDFGLAGSESKGGTPIFASPECLADPERKNKSSDIFSLGRVFLFIILPKEKFLEFLFVSLIHQDGKLLIMDLIRNMPILNLISNMMRIKKRVNLQGIRKELHVIDQIQLSDTITDISEHVEKSTSPDTKDYMDNLKHFS